MRARVPVARKGVGSRDPCLVQWFFAKCNLLVVPNIAKMRAVEASIRCICLVLFRRVHSNSMFETKAPNGRRHFLIKI